MTTLLLDADIFAYQAASACESVFYFGGPEAEPAVDENLEGALEMTQKRIDEVATKLKATRVIVCLTDSVNFRLSVYADYKGNRKNVRKPSTLTRVKEFYAEHYETYQRPGLEADDCMGILSTHKSLVPGRRVIVSEDKDMQTIPGLLFNPGKDKDVRKVSELEANRFFFEQVIVGDATDGYPGCRGVGPKSKFVAELRIATDARSMWETVKAAYASKGFTEADAIVQARCARILRASDWNFQERKVRLWTPPA